MRTPWAQASTALALVAADGDNAEGGQSSVDINLTEHPSARYSVSLIIPTLNEARGMRRVLPAVPPWIHELIVVDGGSTDGTVETVRELCPEARIINQTSKGKGGALKEGIRASTGTIVVTMDADGSMDPGDISAAVRALLAGADFVKGSRELPGAGSADFTWLRRVGNRELTRFANFLFGDRWTDITYGFNAYWRTIMVNVDVLSNGFEFEIQAAARAARTGLRTAEVACYEAPRVGGRSKLNPLRDGWNILRLLLNEAKPRTPTCFRAAADWHLLTEAEAGELVLAVANEHRPATPALPLGPLAS
jgi:glycosyltransferase involved in cell wall biosynthesis